MNDSRDSSTHLKEKLHRFWLENPEPRIIVVGVGRSLRGDESTGLLIAEELAKMKPRNTLVIRAEDRPENYTEQISNYHPTHILYLLATRSGMTPGDTRLITLEKHTITSLHESPLTTLNHYLSALLNVESRLLLVEPQTEIGEPSLKLREAAMRIAVDISESLP
jgi:hydrogenase maturation protease